MAMQLECPDTHYALTVPSSGDLPARYDRARVDRLRTLRRRHRPLICDGAAIAHGTAPNARTCSSPR